MAGEQAVANTARLDDFIGKVLAKPLVEKDLSRRRIAEPFIVLSLLGHLLAMLYGLVHGGIQGVPGPGGGKVMYFDLSKGQAHDVIAAPLAPEKPKLVVTQPKAKTKVPEKPKVQVKAKAPPKDQPKLMKDAYSPENKYVKQELVEEEETTPGPQTPMTLEEELAAQGLKDGKGRGGGGEAPETILNKKGNSLTGSLIQSQMTGHMLYLNLLSREDYEGANGAIDSSVKLNADGTADVSVTHRFFQTYHDQYSSTRSETAKGRWWVDGNRLCLQTPALVDNTKNCYDMSAEGPVLHFYYAPCTSESSMLCKSGRKAGTGAIK
ncbi:MAG: hypothetical protein V4441_09300 [Pseudomonadota bacterium]